MPEVQQISRLILSGFQQFRFLDLDLTDHETGSPKTALVLTGKHGVGKSTVLAHLYHGLDPQVLPVTSNSPEAENALVLTRYSLGEQQVYQARNGVSMLSQDSKIAWFSDAIEEAEDWPELENDPPTFDSFLSQFASFEVNQDESLVAPHAVSAWLHPTLSLFNAEEIEEPRLLADELREQDEKNYLAFLKRERDRDRTLREVDDQFSTEFPSLFEAVMETWSDLLSPLGITIVAGDKTILQAKPTGEEIRFSSLSSALQWQLSLSVYLKRIEFSQSARRRFIAFDSPERRLEGEAALQWLEQLRHLAGDRGQLFVTSQSPNLLESFSPTEQVELICDPDRGVISASHLNEAEAAPAEEAPEPEPHHRAARVARLKRAIRDSDDQDDIADLIDEVMSLR